MPRYKKGDGKRPQTGERANTAKRKAIYLRDGYSEKDKEELIGIAQGIMCDKAVNYLEYPHLKAAEVLLGKNAKIAKMKGKLKHRYKPAESNDNWHMIQFKARKKK